MTTTITMGIALCMSVNTDDIAVKINTKMKMSTKMEIKLNIKVKMKANQQCIIRSDFRTGQNK